MYKIMGPRGCGKTTNLIKYASENNYIVVEPTWTARDNVRRVAERMGFGNVTIISKLEMDGMRGPFLIDELDWFLEKLGVFGYSNTIEP